MWEGVELFSNGKKYNVFTNGIESPSEVYVSVMVFDSNNNDLLSSFSQEKDSLFNYFGELLKKPTKNNRNFYQQYWTTVDPDRWERIKANNNW